MKKYIYISALKGFLSIDGHFYTEEDLDFFYLTEKEWKTSLPKYTFQQLIQMFPEAKEMISVKRSLKENIKEYKQKIQEINEQQERYQNNRINKAHFSQQAELKKQSEKDFDDWRNVWERKIKETLFKLSQLNEKEQPKNTNGVTPEEIERAKQIDIRNFYVGNLGQNPKKHLTGNCPFHKEKTPSFVIYTEQNTWWCFGCNQGGSVVDFVMKLNGITFLEAIKLLLK